MNIFYLNNNPSICAAEHCDKHIVKMCIEYAQLLSTAHRVLDGSIYTEKSKKVYVKRFSLDEPRESILYKACHINHPSSIWVRKSKLHYEWLFNLYIECCIQYTLRYNKKHSSQRLSDCLSIIPTNIKNNKWEEPPLAMPDKYKVNNNAIQSYRNYYIGDKVSFAKWKSSDIPSWFIVN